MAELGAREAKLVQYLNEAYAKEKELETALEAHIGMTTRAPYKKRLREHLTETKRHARELERRVKRLGGTPHVAPIEGFDPLVKGAEAAIGLGAKAMAAAKGPLHAIRGTGEEEKMLKNAKTEFADEHEEIATYTAIEALATELSEDDVAKLARAIRREEESMARFLERLIPSLVKGVVKEEIPASERAGAASKTRAAKPRGAKAAAPRTAKAARSAKSATAKSRAKTTKASPAKAAAKARSATARKPAAGAKRS